MLKKSYITAALLVIVLSVAGCSLLEGGTLAVIKLTASDNGRTIELQVGQVLTFTLDANPSTGYTWEMTKLDQKILQQIGEAEFTPDSTLPGAGGQQVFRFKAVSAGQTSLNLIYHRPWEKDVAPLKTFSLQVVVH